MKGPDIRAAVRVAALLALLPSAKLSLRSLSLDPKECLASTGIVEECRESRIKQYKQEDSSSHSLHPKGFIIQRVI